MTATERLLRMISVALSPGPNEARAAVLNDLFEEPETEALASPSGDGTVQPLTSGWLTHFSEDSELKDAVIKISDHLAEAVGPPTDSRSDHNGGVSLTWEAGDTSVTLSSYLMQGVGGSTYPFQETSHICVDIENTADDEADDDLP